MNSLRRCPFPHVGERGGRIGGVAGVRHHSVRSSSVLVLTGVRIRILSLAPLRTLIPLAVMAFDHTTVPFAFRPSLDEYIWRTWALPRLLDAAPRADRLRQREIAGPRRQGTVSVVIKPLMSWWRLYLRPMNNDRRLADWYAIRTARQTRAGSNSDYLLQTTNDLASPSPSQRPGTWTHLPLRGVPATVDQHRTKQTGITKTQLQTFFGTQD